MLCLLFTDRVTRSMRENTKADLLDRLSLHRSEGFVFAKYGLNNPVRK